MKANHNARITIYYSGSGVSNNAKLLKWKQITTTLGVFRNWSSVFPTMQSY